MAVDDEFVAQYGSTQLVITPLLIESLSCDTVEFIYTICRCVYSFFTNFITVTYELFSKIT